MEVWHLTPPRLDGIGALAADTEAWGFDGLALTDSQNQSPDTYIALTLAARSTSTLKLGPGVTNALTRHPAVTAGAIASLQEISGGRAMLGIGRGDSSLFNIGHKPVGLAPFEAYLRDLQIYLSGGTLDANGYDSTLKWLPNMTQAKVPVDVAATGPKVIAIGARHAERVTFSVGASEERVAEIDREVKLLVAEAYEHCKQVLSDNREMVDEMVEDMIEQETLDYQYLQDLTEKYHPGGIKSQRVGMLAGSQM